MNNIFNLFENMRGGIPHGMPHNMRRNRQSNKNVDNNKLYTILGVPKNADDKTIRKAYLKNSRSGDYCHPDKGGTETNFKKLSLAYEVLKDEEKRKLYNKYGSESLKSNFTEPMSMGGLGGLFGFGQQQQQKREIKKGAPTIFKLSCSLEELCTGKTKKIKIIITPIING